MEDSSTLTFWENVRHNTRWGQYITSIEKEALNTAMGALKKPSVALEIGAEGGYWTNMLAKQGWKVICTDINEETLASARRRVPSATCLKVSENATTLPCATGSVNLIVCFEVFPVIHSSWFYKEASRVLAPGGMLVGVTHNRNSPRSYINKIARVMEPKDKATPDDSHLYKFGYNEWKQYLSGSNFTLLHEEGMCWLPFPRKSDFFLIPQLTRLEERMGLRKVTQYSPWIAFVAQKKATHR